MQVLVCEYLLADDDAEEDVLGKQNRRRMAGLNLRMGGAKSMQLPRRKFFGLVVDGADSEPFRRHLLARIVREIQRLEDEALGHADFGSRVLSLQVLADALGVLHFKAAAIESAVGFIDAEGVAELAELRGCHPDPLDVLARLRNARQYGTLILTLPWAVAYLRRADPGALRLEYYGRVLGELKGMSNALQLSRGDVTSARPRLLLLALIEECRTHFGPHSGEAVPADGSALCRTGTLDSMPDAVRQRVLLACCPQVERIQALLRAKPGLGSGHSLAASPTRKPSSGGVQGQRRVVPNVVDKRRGGIVCPVNVQVLAAELEKLGIWQAQCQVMAEAFGSAEHGAYRASRHLHEMRTLRGDEHADAREHDQRQQHIDKFKQLAWDFAQPHVRRTSVLCSELLLAQPSMPAPPPSPARGGHSDAGAATPGAENPAEAATREAHERMTGALKEWISEHATSAYAAELDRALERHSRSHGGASSRGSLGAAVRPQVRSSSDQTRQQRTQVWAVQEEQLREWSILAYAAGAIPAGVEPLVLGSRPPGAKPTEDGSTAPSAAVRACAELSTRLVSLMFPATAGQPGQRPDWARTGLGQVLELWRRGGGADTPERLVEQLLSPARLVRTAAAAHLRAADVGHADVAGLEALLAAEWPEGWHLGWLGLQCARDGVLSFEVLAQQVHRLFRKVVPGTAAAPAVFAFGATLVRAALTGEGAQAGRVPFARMAGCLLHSALCSTSTRSELAALMQGAGRGVGGGGVSVQLIIV